MAIEYAILLNTKKINKIKYKIMLETVIFFLI